MVRSAAKNHAHVAIVTDPADYAALLAELDAEWRRDVARVPQALAAKAFALTAAYDSTISQWFAFADQGAALARKLDLSRASSRCRCATARTRTSRRRSMFRSARTARGIAQAEQVQGKELSYNNLNDANAALELAAEFRDGPPTVVIVKHANPCGVASATACSTPGREALACDSVSAFGGIVAVNRPLDAATAEAITQIFTEVVVAPDADEAAPRDLRQEEEPALLLTGELPDPARGGQTHAVIAGGMLVQDRDNGSITRDQLKCVTKRQPTEQEARRLPVRLDRRQARQVERHRLCQGRRHRRHRRRPDEPPRQRAHRRRQGARGGRDQRLAEPRTVGSAVASDAFFPFADGCSPRSKPARRR
jgi:phosphoribosylaminoimidazolecarboxamide formyltransferase/IMP cyclohydrolase